MTVFLCYNVFGDFMGYISVIKIAVLVFPIFSLILSLPFLIYHYRKYGSITFLRFFLVFSFFFYLLCAYFLVILPLPKKTEVMQYSGAYYNLKPFFVIPEIFNSSEVSLINPNSYIYLLNQRFLEPLFNILMVIPFGIYLHYYFKCGFFKTLFLSFCLSLFFELTQLSGLYFIYPRPYRLCDVNDLINNTTGGVIGFIITPIFSFFLPSREKIDSKSYLRGREVSIFRKGIALIIDYFFAFVVCYILNFFVESNYIVYFLVLFLIFVIIPFISSGFTFGTWILNFKYIGSDYDGSISFFKYLIKYLLFHIFILNSWFIFMFLCEIFNTDLLFSVVLYCICIFMFLVYCLVCFILNRDIFINTILGVSSISTIGVLSGEEDEI